MKTGRNWTKEEIHAAVMRGPHESALSDEAIAHFAAEAKEKVASKRARLLFYDNVKDNLPEQMKVSPVAAIPHKSKAFRSVLDLAFSLRLSPGTRVTNCGSGQAVSNQGFTGGHAIGSGPYIAGEAIRGIASDAFAY